MPSKQFLCISYFILTYNPQCIEHNIREIVKDMQSTRMQILWYSSFVGNPRLVYRGPPDWVVDQDPWVRGWPILATGWPRARAGADPAGGGAGPAAWGPDCQRDLQPGAPGGRRGRVRSHYCPVLALWQAGGWPHPRQARDEENAGMLFYLLYIIFLK